MQDLLQHTIQVVAWFLQPFATMLVITWVVGLFRRDS